MWASHIFRNPVRFLSKSKLSTHRLRGIQIPIHHILCSLDFGYPKILSHLPYQTLQLCMRLYGKRYASWILFLTNVVKILVTSSWIFTCFYLPRALQWFIPLKWRVFFFWFWFCFSETSGGYWDNVLESSHFVFLTCLTFIL